MRDENHTALANVSCFQLFKRLNQHASLVFHSAVREQAFFAAPLGMDEELSRKRPPLQGAQLDWKLFIYEMNTLGNSSYLGTQPFSTRAYYLRQRQAFG